MARSRCGSASMPFHLALSFDLSFHPEALREWQKLTQGIRERFKEKLAERLIEPRIPASQWRRSNNRYKIKPRATGFRLADGSLLVATTSGWSIFGSSSGPLLRLVDDLLVALFSAQPTISLWRTGATLPPR